jgi:hypothetical protein
VSSTKPNTVLQEPRQSANSRPTRREGNSAASETLSDGEALHEILDVQSHDADLNLPTDRLEKLDGVLRQNEDAIGQISEILSAMCNVFENFSDAVKDLQSTAQTPHTSVLKAEPLRNLRHMLATLTSAQPKHPDLESKEREIQRLAAENARLRSEKAALQAKWDIVQSAMVTATGNAGLVQSPAYSEAAHLGKRKRGTDGEASATGSSSKRIPQLQNFWMGRSSSSKQMPTPHSSSQSDLQSQDASDHSRNTTPGEQSEADLLLTFQGHGQSKTPESSQPGKRPTKSVEKSLHRSVVTSTASANRTSAPAASHPSQRQSSLRDVDASQRDVYQDDSLSGDPSASLRLEEHDMDNGRPPMGENVDFSDMEDAEEIATYAQDGQSEDDDPSFVDRSRRERSAPAADLEVGAPPRTTRSKTQPALRPKQNKMVSVRSSEGAQAARLPPLRSRPQSLGHAFEHSTPGKVKEAEDKRKPKQRVSSTWTPGPGYVATRTKQLHRELRELGLEEWIDRQKKGNPEYRRLVKEARLRRDQEMSAASGIQASDDVDEASTPTPAEVGEEERESSQFPQEHVTPEQQAPAVPSVNRKKSKAQREEEIRRRDELAKAALDAID